MSGFRGSDEALDREIAALEKVGRTRVRRAAADLGELERELRVLRRERARRRASEELAAPTVASELADDSASS
jgi:hypothetical protein